MTKIHYVGDIPPRFEDEFPEEAQIAVELGNQRAEAKARGKRVHPIVLSDEFLASDAPLLPEPIRVESKVGRNDPCPCGSGKKYKKCCGGIQ